MNTLASDGVKYFFLNHILPSAYTSCSGGVHLFLLTLQIVYFIIQSVPKKLTLRIFMVFLYFSVLVAFQINSVDLRGLVVNEI